MNVEDMKKRTKQFGLRVVNLVESLPNTKTSNVIGNQLLRSGTSVGANYRSACRARSKPDFISKASIALEEADESQYWMELLIESGIVPSNRLDALIKEADELVAILTASVKTAKNNQKLARSQ